MKHIVLKVLSSHLNWGAWLGSFDPLLKTGTSFFSNCNCNDKISREEHNTIFSGFLRWLCPTKVTFRDFSCLRKVILYIGPVNKTGTWAAPRRIWTTGACAQCAGLKMSTPQGPELHLEVHVYTAGAWAANGFVWTKEAWAATGRVYSTWLLLDVSTPKGPVLHLDVSAKQGSEQHLGESGQLKP